MPWSPPSPGTLPLERVRSVTIAKLDQAHGTIEHAFQGRPSRQHAMRQKASQEQSKDFGISLTPLFAGIAAYNRGNGLVDIGFACHDGTYSIDFSVRTVDILMDNPPSELAEWLVTLLREYCTSHYFKFLGIGITAELASLCPELPARLWSVLDLVPMIFSRGLEYPRGRKSHPTLDEEADSMARKCLMYFGPNQQPRVQVGYRNEVEVDANGHVRIASVSNYKQTVSPETWKAVMHYIASIKEKNIKLAFFNSTPQGGGVALMRHALIRFFRSVGVDARWYVPVFKPEAFRITKTNHNILQGVAEPGESLSAQQQAILYEWVRESANRYWLAENGPLRPRSEGGADIIIVDDPQMPEVIKISKEVDPDRPVIFRSHIQIRSDLTAQAGTPAADVWDWLFERVRLADVFISHPVREFVPQTLDMRKVGYMPASTDWMDGLNKTLNTYSLQHYVNVFNTECFKFRMTKLDYPTRDFIAQIARFDPAKGIPDVIASYAELRRLYMKDWANDDIPQLVIAGHGAVDDPYASKIYDETLDLLDRLYADIKNDVVVMRLGPLDQMLSMLLQCAKVGLQLSTREGFEVKISEALHKGKPVIATKVGGIPLQIQHGLNGFLVEPGDYRAVAKHLLYLLTDEQMFQRMSNYAATHISDEVSTVGNALSWLYLADTMCSGGTVLPDSNWINDMAREQAGVPYTESECRLPRMPELDQSLVEREGVMLRVRDRASSIC
ncbi:putative trehalose synthase (Ccg-9) [Trichodelitschia bisporula]|uniref:Putative trehalose synthase (Ccg-9) n=1 Tax=Trichodelitschia bisporula TaxID=703511 RepID=A0A6G1I7C9_9PEZI|nr:putative trehalose synthase (Ccg-9) [Trichodelitschia bisporula]